MINNFISGLKPGQRKVLAVLAVVLILGLFGGIFLYPAWKSSNKIDELIAKEKETVRKNALFLAKREKAVKEAAVFKDYFTKDVRSEEEVIADLLKKLLQLANNSGVQVSKLSTPVQEMQKDYLLYVVSADCTGTLENLTNFIFAINNSPELIKVSKMHLGSSANAKNAGTIQASLTISKMIIGADPSVEAKKLVRVQEKKEAAKPAVTSKE